MNEKLKLLFAIVMVAMVTTSWGGDNDKDKKKTYCRFNVHYYESVGRGRFRRKGYFASYANYVDAKGGSMIPAGSEVVIGKRRGGFTLTKVGDTKVIAFEYQKQRMGMSLEEYFKIMFSDKPVSYDKMSEKDKKGIKNGIVAVGMTKEGVKIALGYPAAHKTPSLDDDVWTYWRDRWRMMTVTFKDGKVSEIR